MKVIKFQQYTQYHKELSETAEFLEEMTDTLFSKMIGLATLDKWEQWNDAQSEGTIFHFSEEMLNNTGDKNVDILYELYEHTRAVQEELSAKCNVSKKMEDDIQKEKEIDKMREEANEAFMNSLTPEKRKRIEDGFYEGAGIDVDDFYED
ncbi:hypothetical protein FACS189430_02240 [Bacteroidia bacterium]|nr:hypothetical protein FACS189430_02240 [Bacteroidia bacterium]